MNILFLTFGKLNSIYDHTIYCDLLREFLNHGHYVYALSPGKKESVSGEGYRFEYVDLDSFRGKSNFVKKGFSVLRVEKRYLKAIKSSFNEVKFDLLLYSTPPITLYKAVEYIKKRDKAKTYLLLKDIFPQNAVDLGIMKKKGIKGLVYKNFRRKERKLYSVSDYIGCMSPANVDYVLKHNPQIEKDIVEVCPNSIQVIDKSITKIKKDEIRNKYNIPIEKKVFVYGGNLGKPQDIPFIIECMKEVKELSDVFFVIVGNGSEFVKLENYVNAEEQNNLLLMKSLPKDEYDTLVASCDVGLIFLDYNFSIPNFPSRLLGYMQAKLPVLACTDKNSDVGDVVVKGGFGWKCNSDSTDSFVDTVKEVLNSDFDSMKEREFAYLQENYSVEKGYKIIMSSINR